MNRVRSLRVLSRMAEMKGFRACLPALPHSRSEVGYFIFLFSLLPPHGITLRCYHM